MAKRSKGISPGDRRAIKGNLKFIRVMARRTQVEVAAALQVTQGYISKLERQNDMPISTLQAYLEALGGTVELRARVEDREYIVVLS
jgi:transcriptional regulator with XRE-family HTH domain